jgi:hypothetical protein
MPNPFLNRPKFQEGDLTFIWDTNIGPDDYELSPDGDSVVYHARSTELSFRYDHARIGEPRMDFPDSAQAISEGYKGIYSLNGAPPLKL